MASPMRRERVAEQILHELGDIVQNGIPRNANSAFSDSWSRPNLDRAGLEAIVARWRHAGRERS